MLKRARRAAAERRELWASCIVPPGSLCPLPRSRAVSRRPSGPRWRGRWLTVNVPDVLGRAFGISTFAILGLVSLIGGTGILAPAIGAREWASW